MTHLLDFLHEFSTRNWGSFYHSEFVIPKLPTCYLQLEGFFPTDPSPTMFFQIFADPWMIHILKCLNQLCWSPNKVWTTIGPYQANIPSLTSKSSQTHEGIISLWTFTTKGPNIPAPQILKGASSLILSLGRSAIFCCWNLSLRCLHLRHFDTIDLTTMFNTMTKKTQKIRHFDLIDCYTSTSMCNLIMTLTGYQICSSAMLWH